MGHRSDMNSADFEMQRASPFTKKVKAPPSIRRCRQSLNDDPAFCDTRNTVGCVGELYLVR